MAVQLALHLTVILTAEPCDDAEPTECHIKWMEQYLAPLAHGASYLVLVGTAVLVAFVCHSYARYKSLYTCCRAIQDNVSNLAMIVGSSLDKEKSSAELREWAETFERYLNLLHFFCYREISPALKLKSWPELKNVFLHDRILGLVMVKDKEWDGLDQAFRLGGHDGPGNAILGWLSMLFDEGTAAGYFRDDILRSRMISLNMSFQSSLEGLRGSIAALGFREQFSLPLVYTQVVFLVIDSLCLIQPCAVVYEAYTVGAELTHHNAMLKWSSIVGTILSTAIFTLFFQGLLRIATIMVHPFGLEVDAHRSTDIRQGEYYIEVRSIMNQVRQTTHGFFNAFRYDTE